MNIAAYPKYERYRESGVEWVGAIPSSWEVIRGKWLFKRMDRPIRSEDKIVTCFRDGVVTLRANRRTEGFTNAMKEHGYQGIRKGDLVIHAMDAFAGAIGVSDSDGKSTPVYSACTPRVAGTVDPKFYAYYMRHIALSGLLVAMAKGIRERSTDFRFSDFADLALAVPPIEEQNSIVEFLDGKCTKIDEAVRIKEEQIKLLRERRQILIQQAVTRGLNPDVPMKDSGIDWIGEIPGHWGVTKLKFLSNKIVDGTHFTPEYLDEGVPFLRVTDLTKMQGGKIQWGEVRKISLSAHNELSKRADAEKGDILISKNGTIGLTKVIDWDDEFSFFVSLCLIKLRREVDSRYFEAFFNSPLVDQQLSFGSFRTSVTNLHLERIKELLIVVPPLEEQTQLVENVTEIAAPLDDAVLIKQDQIATLKEYKTSLINAAVTGKIKVI